MEDIETLALFKVAEVELVYRSRVSPIERARIASSSMAYEMFMSVWDMNKIELVEQVKIILLDTSLNCLGVSNIGTGGITGCVADPRIVFATALKTRACSFILAHNHPSQNLTPSRADIRMTEKLAEGGRLLEIPLSDHLIVAPQGYYSFRDNGMIPC